MKRGFLAAALVLASAGTALPCSVVRLATPSELVADAALIVRAKAEGYAAARGNSDYPFTETTWQVSFRILEVLKGTPNVSEIAFNGELEVRDDWNDRPVPYDFIRPGGRKGNCHALGYRKGAEYLLLLRKTEGTATSRPHWTPYWSALTPTNEQVRGEDDAWVRWVRDEIRRLEAKGQEQSVRP